MDLKGYMRGDGRVGFRNHVIVIPLTGCEAEIARRIAEQVPGATCFAHPNGCDLQGADGDLMGTILEHVATHPNVGGVLFLTMGCAATMKHKLSVKTEASGRLAQMLNMQQIGGTSKIIAAGVEAVRRMTAELAGVQRQTVPLSALTIGTKCGASDDNSRRYGHAVIGQACDLLVDRGATVVLSEDGELVPVASHLAKRAATPEISARIKEMAREVNRAWKKRFGASLRDVVVESGMTVAEWRKESMGHARKAGTRPIRAFFDMAEIVHGPGLVVLNAPNTDLESVTCLAAAGCNIILFGTGRGTPVGSPAAVTIKITATARTYELMNENIDVFVGDVIDGKETMDQAAERLIRDIVAAANGQPTKAEVLRHHEVCLPIRGVTF